MHIKQPHARSHLPPVAHDMVLVEEVGGPDDGAAVSWLLTSTLPIKTLHDLLIIID